MRVRRRRRGRRARQAGGAAGAHLRHRGLEIRGVFLGGSRLFPGVAYPVPEGAEVALGDGDGAVTLTVAQKDGGAGTAGVDAMSKMMQMQFEATMDPEVRRALEE